MYNYIKTGNERGKFTEICPMFGKYQTGKMTDFCYV